MAWLHTLLFSAVLLTAQATTDPPKRGPRAFGFDYQSAALMDALKINRKLLVNIYCGHGFDINKYLLGIRKVLFKVLLTLMYCM
jgi:hypothetical protein